MASSQIVSIVALIISSTALIWSTLQLIHSYLSSAKGYSKINEKVMPGWHVYKNRVFLWDQFRFQVNFDTPVLVVCPASNKEFPIRNANGEAGWYVFIGGNEKTALIPAAKVQDPAIHTVDNERATWITLLSAIHQMERDSLSWQNDQIDHGPPSASPPPFREHSLAVAIQRKQRSWDNMPSSITRPYATTTICHIIEIAAMLGLHWKEFDRSKDTFLAEGNGFVLKATSVTDLGTVFTFQVCGKSKFEEGRIIPVDRVKELAFGFVSTIYRDTEDRRRLELPVEEAKDLTTLRLGTTDEFAETLVSLGCNTETSKCIRDNSKRHGHLFPLAFELLGMLGKTFHVKNSLFREEIDGPDSGQRANEHLNRLQNQADKIIRAIRRTQPIFSAPLLNALHQALEVCDEFLITQVALDNVEDVLQKHIQVVLSMLNETEAQPSQGSSTDRKPSFASLDAQSPESKQDQLIEIYFTRVLPKVNGADPESSPLTSGHETKTNIWCALVFRSLCWLTLHDFHKNDKQIARKIELMGNRLPVYVI
ncbi:hypothetical protein F5Y13DRAFT_198971 [Hypoxylon sp. FL1857]|nr:hypothetical protein F5Y13DRAFT_198971 [Hypoxylon sp. FL1857]